MSANKRKQEEEEPTRVQYKKKSREEKRGELGVLRALGGRYWLSPYEHWDKSAEEAEKARARGHAKSVWQQLYLPGVPSLHMAPDDTVQDQGDRYASNNYGTTFDPPNSVLAPGLLRFVHPELAAPEEDDAADPLCWSTLEVEPERPSYTLGFAVHKWSTSERLQSLRFGNVDGLDEERDEEEEEMDANRLMTFNGLFTVLPVGVRRVPQQERTATFTHEERASLELAKEQEAEEVSQGLPLRHVALEDAPEVLPVPNPTRAELRRRDGVLFVRYLFAGYPKARKEQASLRKHYGALPEVNVDGLGEDVYELHDTFLLRAWGGLPKGEPVVYVKLDLSEAHFSMVVRSGLCYRGNLALLLEKPEPYQMLSLS